MLADEPPAEKVLRLLRSQPQPLRNLRSLSIHLCKHPHQPGQALEDEDSVLSTLPAMVSVECAPEGGFQSQNRKQGSSLVIKGLHSAKLAQTEHLRS